MIKILKTNLKMLSIKKINNEAKPNKEFIQTLSNIIFLQTCTLSKT